MQFVKMTCAKVNIKMMLLICLAPKSYFTSYISQI
jgi:hypothetical protein